MPSMKRLSASFALLLGILLGFLAGAPRLAAALPGPGGMVRLSAGGGHTLLLKGDGTVVAWGSNNYGQAALPPGLKKVIAVAAGDAHSVVLQADGTVVAWGDNRYGQTDVPAGLSGVTAIAAGAYHTLALKADGSVVAWGARGTRDEGQATVPADLQNVTAIAAGQTNSLALKADGTLAAWGMSMFGQNDIPAGLGGVVDIAVGSIYSAAVKADGTLAFLGSQAPTPPAGLQGVVAVAVGHYFTVALKADGTVVAFGRNEVGQSTVPAGLQDVTAISAGVFHAVALRADGSVVAWGGDNVGQTEVPSPAWDLGATSVAAGWWDTLVLKSNGSPLYWGSGTSGQMAPPPCADRVRAISGASLALKADGTVCAWGSNAFGQLGLSGATNVKAVAAGWYHNVGLKWDGTLVIAGDNEYGQSTIPAGLGKVTAIAAGARHTVVLLEDGTVEAWGDNRFGQTDHPDLRGVKAVAAGANFSVALRADGTVVGWGNNDNGQISFPAGMSGVRAIAVANYSTFALLSDGTVRGCGLIGDPKSLSGVRALAGGQFHLVALKADGTLQGWGSNQNGSLDIPSTSVALATGANPATAGQPLTLTATVSGLSSSPGKVIFLDGTRVLATVDPDPATGVAVYTLASPATGDLSLRALYQGDALRLDASSATLLQAIRVPTTLELQASASSLVNGDTLTLTATVSPAAATGTVTFLDGGSSLGTATLDQGTATLATTALATGAHTLTAAYAGDGVHMASTATGQAVTITLRPLSLQAPGSSLNPSVYGQSVTFQAELPAEATGSVEFWDGSTRLGTVSASGGKAELSCLGLGAGSHSITVSYASDTVFASAISPASTQVVDKAPATVTLGGLSQTYTGSPLAATATTSPAGLTVSLAYSRNGNPVAAPIAAGTYDVVATIEDGNYTGSATGALAVAKAPATVTLGALSQTYTGSPLAATAATSPAGLTVSLAYSRNGNPVAAPIAAGTYAVVATIEDGNHTGSATGTLVVAKAPATVTLGGLSQTYTGYPLAVTATTSPAGLTVSLAYSWNGNSVAAPTAAGTYDVVATIEDGNHTGSATGTLVVAKAPATVTLGGLSQTYTGYPLAVTATTSPAGLTVSLAYSWNGNSVAAPTAAGTYDVVATIVDGNHTGSATGTLVVAKAPATVTLGCLSQTFTGYPLAVTATTSPAGLTVSLAYSWNGNPVAAPTAVGTYAVVATIVDANYAGSAEGSLIIQPGPPPSARITFNTPTLRVAPGGTVSGSFQLSATGISLAGVQLSVAGLPPRTTLTFSQPEPGSTPSQGTVAFEVKTTSAFQKLGRLGLPGRGSNGWDVGGGAGVILACCLAPWSLRRRRGKPSLLFLGIALVGLGSLIACGGSSTSSTSEIFKGTVPGSYQVTVKASAGGQTLAEESFTLQVTP